MICPIFIFWHDLITFTLYILSYVFIYIFLWKQKIFRCTKQSRYIHQLEGTHHPFKNASVRRRYPPSRKGWVNSLFMCEEGDTYVYILCTLLLQLIISNFLISILKTNKVNLLVQIRIYSKHFKNPRHKLITKSVS